ncbi:YphA family membrane protein [Paenibacillus rigui]|uniref:Uncharacterized protein n=1 Tax=Paenibacillus rigui TaxID=554312 RepID=A0A229UXD2_9BACL|nr:hypothetical protein [Paenibacillus rigui]OXM88084.1 hypothetical protein CF651_03065 [Paenibacillus rigui]
MNSGYLSLVLMVVTLILFASGWKDSISRGITNKVILLFFVSWIIGMKFPLVFAFGQCSPIILLLCLVIIGALWRAHGQMYRLHLISIGILLGSVTFFMLEALHLVPFLVIINQDTSIALVVALLVSFMTRNTAVQIAVASMGLLIGETYYRYLHREHIGFQLGNLAFQDRWWLTVFLARGISLVLAGIVTSCKKSIQWIIQGIRRRSGGRE